MKKPLNKTVSTNHYHGMIGKNRSVNKKKIISEEFSFNNLIDLIKFFIWKSKASS